MMSKEEILRAVREKGVKCVYLWFLDLEGILKGMAISPHELERALDIGMSFDGSSVSGFNAIEESDMIAFPDTETFSLLPWRDQENLSARMFCDIIKPGEGSFEGDPRYILKRVLEKAKSKGYAYYIGPELEYFYFKNNGHLETLDAGGYFSVPPLDLANEIKQRTITCLNDMGIQVEYSHHEVAPSQHEIDLRYAEALKMADQVVTHRYLVKEVATRAGLYATFMPKPLSGVNGSGMHTHQSLFRDGRNAFFDQNDQYKLSTIAKSFIAGQLKYAREICVFLAQWVNSYKRLVPGFEAPVYVAWSRINRSALIRVPHALKESSTRCELRCADPSCNPYLAFALMLAAGLKGIEENLELEPPVTENLYHLSAREREEKRIRSLPASLEEALESAKNSVVVRETLGDHTLNAFIDLKYAEWDRYRVQVTPWEVDTFFRIL